MHNSILMLGIGHKDGGGRLMVVVQYVTYGIEFAVSWRYQMDKATLIYPGVDNFCVTYEQMT